jgi:hypothetical protein
MKQNYSDILDLKALRNRDQGESTNKRSTTRIYQLKVS